METDDRQTSHAEKRDEDGMNYVFTIVCALLAWIISGQAVFTIGGALLGWIIDERRVVRKRRAARAEVGEEDA